MLRDGWRGQATPGKKGQLLGMSISAWKGCRTPPPPPPPLASLPHCVLGSLCWGDPSDTNALPGQPPSWTRVSSCLRSVWGWGLLCSRGVSSTFHVSPRQPRSRSTFPGVSRCLLEMETWAWSRHALPLPCVQLAGGRKRIMQHLSNMRARSMHYKATYFSPLLTSPSGALLGAKRFSQVYGDVLPALRLLRAEAAVCSLQGRGGCSPGLGWAGACPRLPARFGGS